MRVTVHPSQAAQVPNMLGTRDKMMTIWIYPSSSRKSLKCHGTHMWDGTAQFPNPPNPYGYMVGRQTEFSKKTGEWTTGSDNSWSLNSKTSVPLGHSDNVSYEIIVSEKIGQDWTCFVKSASTKRLPTQNKKSVTRNRTVNEPSIELLHIQ